MRGLEERLGLRLLARTTRSVAPTEAGERLMRAIGPHLESVAEALAAVSRMRDTPAGLCASAPASTPPTACSIPPSRGWRATIRNRDRGLRRQRLRRHRRAALRRRRAARRAGRERHGRRARRARHAHGDRRDPGLFRALPAATDPARPDPPRCIAMRLPTFGGLLPWEFEKDGREVACGSRRVDLQRHGDGAEGGARRPRPRLLPGRSRRALCRRRRGWSACSRTGARRSPGYHLYYPSRRQHSAAFAVVVEALRYRGPTTRGS